MHNSRWSSIESFANGSHHWENNAVFEVFYQIEDFNKFRTSAIWYSSPCKSKEQIMNVLKNISFSYDTSKLSEEYWRELK